MPRSNYHLFTWILTLVGLLWFLSAFFLAKRSLPHASTCDEACPLLMESLGLTVSECQLLQRKKLLAAVDKTDSQRQGCWMNRKVHSMVYIVVDALRFDFALYDLPQSLGQRLSAPASLSKQQQRGQLFQFVADPPTVTMQRLKALTTGGLPTFAEFSTNLGGASVEDDSWIRLLNKTPWQSRGLAGRSQAAFVGDDTWADLYPTEFTTALPYPSFNTRDLDTVDNGCLQHIPHLMDHLRGIDANAATNNNTTTSSLAYEVLIVHFLGVDHVGHTYGPHNQHMDAKLRQMDDALAEILDRLDASMECHAALIMGDHGMTADGNHGGGTEEETHAALFVQMSSACGKSRHTDWHLESVRRSELVQQEFGEINQIDLVPTISLLLGIPIPYANLGSLVPSFMPGTSTAEAATGLALNAAQVWRYFTVYSHSANRLPHLDQLQTDLDAAVQSFRKAFHETDNDDEQTEDLYLQAATLFKDFLHKALALGQRVWTRFDALGMTIGILILTAGLVLQISPLLRGFGSILHTARVEDVVAVLFSVFICGVLTFSNSYILEEEHVHMYALAIIATTIALRIRAEPIKASIWRGVLLLSVASRLSGLFVTGHGLDPSLLVHTAHRSALFLSSVSILAAGRWYLLHIRATLDRIQAMLDCSTLISLAVSWWEKRQPDPDRNGYFACRVALALCLSGVVLQVSRLVVPYAPKAEESTGSARLLEWVAKLLIVTVAVTGPSTSTTVLLLSFQMTVVFLLSRWNSPIRVSSSTLAILWRFIIRHTFFSTSHACTLNRLQLSAAFVATSDFNFALGGVSLFVNTFGWEMIGALFAYICSQHQNRAALWKVYGALQILEALTSSMSVSVLRRHLMVWDIYAPHFLFVSIFTCLCGLANLVTA